MERTWRLSGLEYLVLRERLVDRKQSWPFTYISDIRGYYDFQFAKARVWGELQAAWDPALADVLVKSLRADIRMVVHAEDLSAERRQDGLIVLAAKKFGDRAVLIQGFGTVTPESHDELEITECDAASLTRLLVDKLPPMAAGSQARVELLDTGRPDEFDHWHRRSSLYDEGDRDVDARCRQWQAAPKATVGRIVLTHGHSTFGPRGQVTKWLVWEDHPGDGRYVIGMEQPVAAVAADAAGLRTMIDRHCDELLLVRDDESRGGLARASVYDDGR
ncbi:ESAT-6 protein secretion system EspG family protein [Nocardia tenerifensis]|uniref:ESAT-6 protein secretion system EspG family protein n=1 Tax=Nocardia tenerifensis TaxID=228006 RepID=A0A318K0A4_9NOCA|nr:ESX secretion-associated protein EspG [Nocardia tenerifensis]PXX61697.1 ESAT-6 protein secretion system EspG family protein [Nocardia tenerifensis]